MQGNEQEKGESTMSGCFTNNEENGKPGPDGSGEQGTVLNTTVTGQVRKSAARMTAAPLPAVRATALRGQSITRPQEPKSTLRRRTQLDIYGKDPEIPYVKFEAAARDLVCSLMERQDRMNEEIFYKLNDLAFRIEDLEQDRARDGEGR